MKLTKVKDLIPAPKDGQNVAVYEIVPSVTSIHADKDGNVLTGYIEVRAYKTFLGVRSNIVGPLAVVVQGESSYWVQYKVDSNAWTNCGTITIGSGIAAMASYGVSGMVVAGITKGIAFRLVYGRVNSTYSVVCEMGALPVVKDGQTGAAGAVGKFYYPAGEYDDSTPYTSSGNSAPYVWISEVLNNVIRIYYYMLVASTNLVNGTLISPGDPDAAGVWELMTNDFRYLISEAVFTMFAKLGSAVFCGDWMISQYGTVNGSTSNQYQLFDPTYPDSSVSTIHTVNGDSWQGYNFVPNFAVDLLTGTVYMNDAHINGEIIAKSMNFVFADICDYRNDEGDYDVFRVGIDTETHDINGNVVENIGNIWNFKAAGDTIVLPTRNFTKFGLRVTVYNPWLGLGGTSNVTRIEAGYYDDSYDDFILSDLRGIGTNYTPPSGSVVPENTYRHCQAVDFFNGVVEVMCVPPSDINLSCEWVVVNIGTIFYKYQQISQ